jgi:CRISPR-associated endonuclease Cas1
MIGSDGFITFEALRWLADQDAAFVMLDRDGSVLCTTGPVRPSDARLRRAQALAAHTGVDVTIARELISQKLAGQERVARDKLHNSAAAQAIAGYRLDLAEAEKVETIRTLESQGAAAYWAAWRDEPVTFPKKDLPRIPEHWRTFGTRKSPLSGSPRLAVGPANAILNYLYSVLESETRLAAAALGLDPGLGFIHVDAPARDSLACDLMEPVRPKVDAYLLDWLTQQPLRREWFFEQRDGNCRLMGSFAVRLSESAPVWARAVAPLAEWVASKLWSGRGKQSKNAGPPTHLTQTHRRQVKTASSTLPEIRAPRRENICRGCGKPIAKDSNNCPTCYLPSAAEQLKNAAHAGRVGAHTPSAEARRGKTQRRQAAARRAWRSSEPSLSLTEDVYVTRIQPLLVHASTSAIRSALGVSRGYAADIRRGKRRPHPRHWQALAQLAGLSAAFDGVGNIEGKP